METEQWVGDMVWDYNVVIVLYAMRLLEKAKEKFKDP